MKFYFEELHTFSSMLRDISSSAAKTEEAEFLSSRGTSTVKEITIFDGNLC